MGVDFFCPQLPIKIINLTLRNQEKQSNDRNEERRKHNQRFCFKMSLQLRFDDLALLCKVVFLSQFYYITTSEQF